MNNLCFTALTFLVFMSGVHCFRTTCKYDHFVYTQQWPQSICTCDEGIKYLGESCQIPENVKTWTIHGLWPTCGISHNPQNCNDSWHFEEHQILKIESKLEIYWPQLIDNSHSRISFWEHEWKKHGTCCTDKLRLNSEFKYFDTGLDLNQKFNILRMLEQGEITPSKTKSYQLGDIRKAIQTGLNGPKPYIHCCKGKDKKQRIQEVMICLDTEKLLPMDCIEHDDYCDEDVPVYYEPIIPSTNTVFI